MGFPAIDPSEVGLTGLLWLFLTYGYVLFYSSNLIAEGSDLLLLIPSMAGLVGGLVLPILGAVPDGAIILFSGLGDIEQAQETLSVGVGALAGSIIMLLTVPWAFSVMSGRVDITAEGTLNYLGKPKLSPNQDMRQTLFMTGVALNKEVQHGGIIMVLTTIPYFLIQVPALFLHGPAEEVAEGEKYWALGGLVICLIGFVSYLVLQLRISKKGTDKLKRVAIMKKLLTDGKVSLSGALVDTVKMHGGPQLGGSPSTSGGYQSLTDSSNGTKWYPPPETKEYLKEILNESFMKYDKDKNSLLDKSECHVFLSDFHEDISDREVDTIFSRYDVDNSGAINEEEFLGMVYHIILMQIEKEQGSESQIIPETGGAILNNMFEGGQEGQEEEEEEVPEDITSLPPHEQQRIIKKRAFIMLAIGTTLVLIFSDPMVDVMQEIASRAGLNSFYVAFVLAPLASNASEVIASQYYAAKKTRKTITVSLTALEGAASMNNTFCLSIFMGLVYFRGLAWQYTAETIAIVLVEVLMSVLVQRSKMSTFQGLLVLFIFPLSLVLVATLEAFGLD
uniref:EF-hand domain-containing protein n=1 Tax=Minutocellus polymorphus TaxID=265543 RepID=A0A7S0AGX5_9STRA|mmetsp:Transcript_14009/g.23332  ORF Transcript_14009/g.23332 Transcript_14009/m.23332 type:complete len:562 (+) Transcript_14009:79-1764(+)